MKVLINVTFRLNPRHLQTNSKTTMIMIMNQLSYYITRYITDTDNKEMRVGEGIRVLRVGRLHSK